MDDRIPSRGRSRRLSALIARCRRIWQGTRRGLRATELTRLPSLLSELAPLDMRFVGRTLWHTCSSA